MTDTKGANWSKRLLNRNCTLYLFVLYKPNDETKEAQLQPSYKKNDFVVFTSSCHPNGLQKQHKHDCLSFKFYTDNTL